MQSVFIRQLIALSAIILFTSSIQAQNEIKISRFCAFSYQEGLKDDCDSEMSIPYEEISTEDTIKKSIITVLQQMALRNNTLSVGIIDNRLFDGLYCKAKDDNIPRIFINRKYIQNYWLTMGILFHELGHALNHHENLCSNSELELDADLFAGRCLAMLKATQDQALACTEVISTTIPTLHKYPTKQIRISQIIKGYRNALNQNTSFSYTSFNPKIRWNKEKKGVRVTIEGKSLIIPYLKGWKDFGQFSIDPVMGILYIDSTNSTYQLIGYWTKTKGLGHLVNDLTPLTYIRTGDNSFKMYSKSRIIPYQPKDDTITEDNGRDYEMYYFDEQKKQKRRIVLIDYFYVNLDVLMPAFFK